MFITKAIETNMQVDAIYFDFKKAFDRVDSKILLKKLKSYGVVDPLLISIKNYLEHRTQVGKINNNFSIVIKVTSGIPASILDSFSSLCL